MKRRSEGDGKLSKRQRRSEDDGNIPEEPKNDSLLSDSSEDDGNIPEEPKNDKLLSYTGDRVAKNGVEKRDGVWSVGGGLQKDVSEVYFKDSKAALGAAQFLDRLRHTNIPKLVAVMDTSIVVERLPPVPLVEWLDHDAGKEVMWTLDRRSGKRYLELNKRYSKVFRPLVGTLAYLHMKGISHGNLLEGIFVTEPTDKDIRLSIINFNINIGFAVGLNKDLRDLRHLVRMTVKKHSTQIQVNGQLPREPPALRAFYRLFVKMKQYQTDHEEMREFSSFIYWSPLFYNWKDRRDFLKVIEKFSVQSIDHFKQLVVCDYSPPSQAPSTSSLGISPTHPPSGYAIPSMKSWKKRVLNLPKSNAVRAVFEFSPNGNLYAGSGGIYWLHRCCIHHFEGKARKDSDQRAVEALLKAFPRALPAILERLIGAFNCQQQTKFRKRLTVFLREALEDRFKGGL